MSGPATPEKKDLTALRNELAQTDTELVRLLAERMKLIRAVAQYKAEQGLPSLDRKSTRLNSSHSQISYAVFCLKKKKKRKKQHKNIKKEKKKSNPMNSVKR